MSGHSDFELFNSDGASSVLTWVYADIASVYADIASAACPAHPVNLDIISEDTTRESPTQDPSLSTFSQPDNLQLLTAPSQSTYHFSVGFL